MVLNLKKDIIEIKEPLETIQKLKPKEYEWDTEINQYEKREKAYGFIAQDTQVDFPHLIYNSGTVGEVTDALGIDMNSFIALNTAGIQQLLIKVSKMENKIMELEAKISGSC